MVEETAPWSPWRHLQNRHPDVQVHEVQLPGDYLGCVDLQRRIVWLDARLTQAERRCTLAHEIGHLERGLPCDPAADPGEEKAIDEWAARKLIDIGALVRAFKWSCHLPEIADELWVDLHMLRARLRALTDEEQDEIMAAIERTRVA